MYDNLKTVQILEKLINKNDPCKTYPNHLAKKLFSDLDIYLTNGNFLVVHGKNGVGKSTLLKTLIGVITSNTGSQDYLSERFKNLCIGYVSSNVNSFFNRLSVMENLIFFLMMRGFNKDQSTKKIRDVSIELQIDASILDQKYMFLSSGERKKVSIIRCFAHET